MSGSLKKQLEAALPKGAASVISAQAPEEAGNDPLSAYLGGVGALCPFLGRMMRRDRQRLDRVLASSPDDLFESLMPVSGGAGAEADTAKPFLRGARNDIALAVALADLAGLFSLDQVTETLSRFADRAIAEALRVAALEAGKLRGVKFEDDPCPDHGIIIIAMGKLGARELNYSSDIDLVSIYDPDLSGLAPDSRLDARGLAVKTTQIMLDILSEQTVEGFVFRTDMRLRPNPGATGVSVSFAAAERYYEEYGQNWERAAFIKGRVCAGNEKVGRDFAEMIQPFVWRRTLDFGAVSDIHAIKQQIHAEKGRPDLDVPGADVKLGPGGIREVEFFAQTQQLILGGRDRTLRSPRTEEALMALAAEGHVDQDTAEGMCAAYRYFRAVEHRLQMREDAQTQTLPEEEEDLARIAALMDMADVADFLGETERHMRFVHDAYADLFHTPEPREPVPGSLVFTGVEDDPRTLETLRRIGFASPEAVTERIRRWHQGGLRATRTARARELLTALVPHILMQLGTLDEPDRGFAALDGFLSRLPGGFQVFSLFTTHPEVLADVLVLCQSSPELTRRFGERPALIEGLLEGVEITPPTPPFAWDDDPYEVKLDRVRQAVNEHRVRSSAALILGQARPADVAGALSQTADAAIADLIAATRQEAEEQGKAPAGKLAAVAFGRLGIEALTVLSDLDLVFVYELDDDSPAGEQLFTRLVRRIVNALSVQTGAGGLYTIDMKLRPSGGAGPTAVAYHAFDRYYANTAWTWEMMALTKARVVWADAPFGKTIEDTITRHLRRPQETDELKTDVIDMRRRLMKEKPPRSPLDIKRLAGGLTDIDFIVQYLSLAHGKEYAPFPRHPVLAIDVLAEKGLLETAEAATLKTAYEAEECLIQYARATVGEGTAPSLHGDSAARLRHLWTGWTDEPFPQQIEQHATAVRRIFEDRIGVYLED